MACLLSVPATGAALPEDVEASLIVDVTCDQDQVRGVQKALPVGAIILHTPCTIAYYVSQRRAVQADSEDMSKLRLGVSQ